MDRCAETFGDIRALNKSAIIFSLYFASEIDHDNPIFVGSLVKIPCHGFKWNPDFRNAYLHWSMRANYTVTEQRELITSTIFVTEDWETHCHNDFFKGRVSVSVPSGHLIISKTRKGDQGLYKCEFINSAPNQHRLLLYGKFSHNV